MNAITTMDQFSRFFRKTRRLIWSGPHTELNTAVNWEELGFVCDGRFLFSQRTLETCYLPAVFNELRKPHLVKKPMESHPSQSRPKNRRAA